MPLNLLLKSGKLLAVLCLISLLSGCAEIGQVTRYPYPPLDDFWGGGTPEPVAEPVAKPETVSIETHHFNLNGKDTIIGHLATVSIKEGDTLLDIARHFGVGYQHIVESNPGLDIWVPQTDLRANLPLQFTLPNAKRTGVVINTATMRLFYFHPDKQSAVSTWPVGIGREGRSTPLGAMAIGRKMQHPTWYVPESIRRTHAEQGDPLPPVVPPGPDNPLGDFALYLTKPSYLIHGTNKPFSIGIRASNGCIRLYPEDIARAFQEIPVGTPVNIVNQPYLLGWLNGVLYLEAHEPYEEVNGEAAYQALKAELERIGKESQQKIDWPKVAETVKKARGMPVPIFEHTPSLKTLLANAPRWERPAQLYGQPDKAQPGKAGWFVRTESIDEYRAKKLAAQMNHFGPRIPAYTVPGDKGHQVIGGPFTQEHAANRARLALNEDFNTKSEIIKPDKNYTPPKPSAEVKKADQAEAAKPVKPEANKPATTEASKTDKPEKPDKPDIAKNDKADAGKPAKAEAGKPAKPDPEKPVKAETAKPAKPAPDKPVKAEAAKPAKPVAEPPKASPPEKPVERKPKVVILKLPKPM